MNNYMPSPALCIQASFQERERLEKENEKLHTQMQKIRRHVSKRLKALTDMTTMLKPGSKMKAMANSGLKELQMIDSILLTDKQRKKRKV